jgi:hypothetical protein
MCRHATDELRHGDHTSTCLLDSGLCPATAKATARAINTLIVMNRSMFCPDTGE